MKQGILVTLLLFSHSSICCIYAARWVSWSKGCLHGATGALSPRSVSLPHFQGEPCVRCHGHHWTSPRQFIMIYERHWNLDQAFWFKHLMLAYSALRHYSTTYHKFSCKTCSPTVWPQHTLHDSTATFQADHQTAPPTWISARVS